MSNEPPKFSDPYEEAHSTDNLTRISSWIPENEKLFIQAIRPGRGTLQTTINLFLKGLIDECRKRGITTYNECNRFEQLVLERTSLIVSPSTTTPVTNVGGGTPSDGNSAKNMSLVDTNVPGGSGKRSRGKKANGTEGKNQLG